MKKNQIKKLTLKIETVRNLDDHALREAVGGVSGSECPTVMICPTLTCLTKCTGCNIKW